MYCGRHTHFFDTYTSTTPIVCEDCQQVAREADRKVTKEAQKGSCIYFLVGLVLFIIGASLMNSIGWPAAIFIILGLIGLGLGALTGLSWLD